MEKKCREKSAATQSQSGTLWRSGKANGEVNEGQSFIYNSKCSILVSLCILVSESEKIAVCSHVRLYL